MNVLFITIYLINILNFSSSLKVTETLGRNGVKRILVVDSSNNNDESLIEKPFSFEKNRNRNGNTLLKEVFLPKDYPTSVPPEYIRYQLLNIAQDFCSYLRSILSTASILKGFGVGDASIAPVTATINWIYRSGAAMLGNLFFSAIARFDTNAKSYRFFADLINNVGLSLDLIACIGPKELFLPIICVASVCKSLCATSAGAAGAAINVHFGSKGNVGDVLAKSGAQHTFVNLIGLASSVSFTRFIHKHGNNKRLLFSFVILTTFHILLNYEAMKTLAFTSINQERVRILVNKYIILIDKNKKSLKNIDINDNKLIEDFSPASIAREESILMPLMPSFWPRFDSQGGKQAFDNVKLFISPQILIDNLGIIETEKILKNYIHSSKPYFIIPLTNNDVNESSNRMKNVVAVMFKPEANSMDTLKASLQASLHSYFNNNDAITMSSSVMDDHFEKFLNLLIKAGWDIQKNNDKAIILEPRNARFVRVET